MRQDGRQYPATLARCVTTWETSSGRVQQRTLTATSMSYRPHYPWLGLQPTTQHPTPATTSENGPHAAETQPGGPFPSYPVRSCRDGVCACRMPPVVPGDPADSAGNEDGPAADPAVAKVIDGVVGGVQGVAGGVERDFALAGEGDQIG